MVKSAESVNYQFNYIHQQPLPPLRLMSTTALTLITYHQYTGDISSKFSGHFETFASEICKNIEEI